MYLIYLSLLTVIYRIEQVMIVNAVLSRHGREYLVSHNRWRVNIELKEIKDIKETAVSSGDSSLHGTHLSVVYTGTGVV